MALSTFDQPPAIPLEDSPACSRRDFGVGERGLDPADWSELRALDHRMMDDMFDHLAGLRANPPWRKLPDAERRALRSQPLPRQGMLPDAIYSDFQRLIEPYATGNQHPRFMGWVHGAGNPVGMLAELLAAGLNCNLGGRDHAGLEVERQVIAWSAEMFGLPPGASGLLVTGSSVANLIAVLVARRAALGPQVREHGLAGARLVAYAASSAHLCIARALDMAGLGSGALRRIPVDAAHRIDLAVLEAAISHDRAEGLVPFMVVGTAGTVDCGAVDDLVALRAICRAHGLWFHVDAAFGAFATLSPRTRPLVQGIETADGMAFDWHKWGQVPYDAGCVLVRDAELYRETFAHEADYLSRGSRGLSANSPWPCDLGPDLSRGFRA